MAQASYPAELLYHPEHDWARIEADESDPAHPLATLGITWYAQDALGEVVFFDPPAVGTTLAKAPLYADPATINEDPYGEGWLVKVRLSDPSERDALLDAASYKATLAG